ncbi:hypothetical protein OHC33_005795 [Knufia fluminis]|uniref:Protein ZIP4 homolog n=1 Tax=Knufia fluminis TaxID=191047 RepID=A0AAN8IMI6_9EURO|nr:hypothetical protein OHC33_005795 [Knufia fluminis]
MTVASRSQTGSIIDFSSRLRSVLQKSQNALPDDCPDVLLYTSTLPLAPTEFSKSQKIELREHAVCIWNSCNLISASGNPQNIAGVAKLRAFTYLLLASIAPPSSKKSANISKLYENFLTATRECLQAGLVELAGRVLELEANTPILLNKVDTNQENVQEHISCMIDYYSLRLLYDWRRHRADLADRHYSSLLNMPYRLQEADAEKIVDLLFEIGRECLSQQDIHSAISWLERAMHMMNADGAYDSFAGSDLRLNVMHCLAQALSALPDHDDAVRARDILKQLEKEYGAKLPILLLSLEVACNQHELDSDTISNQLEGIIHTAHLIEANHRLIMYYIQQLTSASPLHATRCLKHYLLQRLIPEGNFDWTEKSIVSYIAMHSTQDFSGSAPVVQGLEQELGVFSEAMKCSLGPVAAQAAHVLV